MTRYWLSCPKFTVMVTVDGSHTIIRAAPLVKRFVDQPLENLLRWMQRFGAVETVEL